MMQNILIVDDKDENLIALESLLEQPGLGLLKAGNGNDALRMLLKNDVALVLLDVKMPGMSGFEMAEIMRRNKKTQTIPIIFVTANDTKPFMFRGYEVGAVDFLAKPLDRNALLGKVKVLLELDRHRRELEIQLEEVRRQQQQNWKLLSALGDGLVAVDAGGEVTFANPAMNQLFGLDPQVITDRNVSDIIVQHASGVSTPWLNSDIFISSSKGERLTRDVGFFVRGAKELVPTSISAAPIQDAEGGYAGAVFTLRVSASERDKADVVEELAKKGRRQSRKKMSTVLRMFERSSGSNLGRLANISQDGLKLITRNTIPDGTRYQISTILPETIAGSNTLSFECVSVWCRPRNEHPQENSVGFRITRISENDMKVLTQLIERY
jgi:PAS domain S-box-containing protein